MAKEGKNAGQGREYIRKKKRDGKEEKLIKRERERENVKWWES